MADKIPVKISTMPLVGSIQNFIVLGVDLETNQNAKANMEQLRGNTGATPNIALQVESLPYGSAPAVSKSGTAKNPTYKIGLPLAKNGEKPELRISGEYVQYKYESDPEWQNLLNIDVLRLHYADLTEEQLLALKKPAIDAATVLGQYVSEKDEVLKELQRQTAAAAAAALFTASHPTYIGEDFHVYRWNLETGEYEKINVYVKGEKGDSGKEPKIENGTITTGEPGSSVQLIFTYTGESESGQPVYRIDGLIPQGQPGTGNGNVFVTVQGLDPAKTYLFQPGQTNSPVGVFIEYNEPEVPRNVSDLQNDSDFQRGSQVEAKIGTHNTNGTAHRDIRGGISAINEKIPGSASSTNKLVDTDTMNSSVSNMAANYVTYNAAGNAFATKASLTDATEFYHGGVAYIPTEHDYVTVLVDESQDGGCWRYTYTGSAWSVQYRVNEAPMTQAQLNALNSGITEAKVVSYDNLLTYPKHKSAVLLPSNWQLFEDTGLYRILVEDAQVIDGCSIDGGVDATDAVSYEAWETAQGIIGVFDTSTVGKFHIYAKKLPAAKYTISV